MSCNCIVRCGGTDCCSVPVLGGDGPTGSATGGESPPLFKYLSDEQLAALAIFTDIHCGDEIHVILTWDLDQNHVHELTISCFECDVTEHYPRERR